MKVNISFKKVAILLLTLYLLFNFIRYITADYILNAVVNEENGNVSFLTHDCELRTYDAQGNLLYSKRLDLDGTALLKYYDGRLYVYELRTEIFYSLDDQGEIDDQFAHEYSEEMKSWLDWESDSWGYYLSTDTYVYLYRKPNFWRFLIFQRTVDFEITDVESKETIILWDLANGSF